MSGVQCDFFVWKSFFDKMSIRCWWLYRFWWTYVRRLAYFCLDQIHLSYVFAFVVPLFVNIYLRRSAKQCELLLHVTDVSWSPHFAVFWTILSCQVQCKLGPKNIGLPIHFTCIWCVEKLDWQIQDTMMDHWRWKPHDVNWGSALHHGSNCLLPLTMDGCIMCCDIISLCQLHVAATSKIVKNCWAQVWLV